MGAACSFMAQRLACPPNPLHLYSCACTKEAKPGHHPPSESSVLLSIIMLRMRGRELCLVDEVNAALGKAIEACRLLEDMRKGLVLATTHVAELEEELGHYITALNERFSSLPRYICVPSKSV